MRFVLASHNKKKMTELAAILDELGIEIVPLPADAPEPVEDGASFEENALIKARAAASLTGLPAISDDSGLCVDALGGAPGIYSARYCAGDDHDRNTFLLQNMAGRDNRSCRFVCAIACVLPNGDTLAVRGECEGELMCECHGEGGFGYDPLFYVPAYGCTFGELAPEIKNRISHRTRALQTFKQALKELLEHNTQEMGSC